ncbi:hypothetical protein KQX54_008463 [Cotesia glomerata]|uniref:Uncharacterized protein n=1 Tax=Cotesia glomerata TaxID=32391 RepID=A0AAV7J1X4_COTGL|nr:hypothetical protein KQX54_008463 [Cotesia glomerata]
MIGIVLYRSLKKKILVQFQRSIDLCSCLIAIEKMKKAHRLIAEILWEIVEPTRHKTEDRMMPKTFDLVELPTTLLSYVDLSLVDPNHPLDPRCYKKIQILN